MYIVDTNLLIRFFTQDDKAKAEKVERLLRGKSANVYIDDLAIAETVWVLKSVYQLTKQDIVVRLQGLLGTSAKLNRKVLFLALENYVKYNISWIDAYLAALAKTGKYKGIYSYDESFDKVPGLRRIEP